MRGKVKTRATSKAKATKMDKVAPVAALLCRSCGKRPGLPSSILGQLATAELCGSCLELRRQRIKANRLRDREIMLRRNSA